MTALKPITIVGGGLAGLTLGIGLRQRDVPVTVWEAGQYPRHRVCGEFISGNGRKILARLGLRERLDEAGAFEAKTTAFVAGKNHSPVRTLPEPALCLSRHALDFLLAKTFQEFGGELRSGERWQKQESTEGLVRASGRRAQSTDAGWRWFGLKMHVRDVNLSADLEMHVTPNGYVGVNRIGNGEVNVCGLFRARKGKETFRESKGNEASSFPPLSAVESKAASANGFPLLLGKPGSLLHERLANATIDQASLCSVAGLSLKPQHATDKNECRLGDALTMIPPVTGNGMSMAFESAALAIEPLAAFSRNETTWPEAQQAIARACDHAFARRLAWARLLQWLMFSPVLQTKMGGILLRSDLVWRMMFARTR